MVQSGFFHAHSRAGPLLGGTGRRSAKAATLPARLRTRTGFNSFSLALSRSLSLYLSLSLSLSLSPHMNLSLSLSPQMNLYRTKAATFPARRRTLIGTPDALSSDQT